MTNPPLARTSDPITSHEAAARVTNRESIKARCLAYIRAHPGVTAGQVGVGTDLGYEKVWRRVSELKNDGLIYEGVETREWGGRQQVTLYPYGPEGGPQRRGDEMTHTCREMSEVDGPGDVVRIDRLWYIRRGRVSILIRVCPYCGMHFSLVGCFSDAGSQQGRMLP